jgi:transposase
MATREVAMTYTAAAVEWAMKVQEVILRALSGQCTWAAVADILGVSARTVRRLRWRYQQYGYDGLLDCRRRMPSLRRVPVGELQRILRLYRERYLGFNVRHFCQLARREHGLRFSYTLVKAALQGAGLVAKRRARGRHRRRREPRPCFGELVHLDGSRHAWLALEPDTLRTLLVVLDDATKHLLYAQFVEGGESTAAILTALRDVLHTHGLPGALYTDRAGWAVSTPTSGTAPDRSKLTQVGRALARLGIEIHRPGPARPYLTALGCMARVRRRPGLQIDKQRGRRSCRELIHIGVTDQPTAAWAAQQIVHAFPNETGPAYLLRDRDAIYGADFQRRVERMGIRQVVITPRVSLAESLRRACHRLDSPRMPRARHRTERTSPATRASHVPRVRQRCAASPESR